MKTTRHARVALGAALAASIEQYRNSGEYQRAQRLVNASAQEYLESWLRKNCESPGRCHGKKPAAVFDIDDTLFTALYGHLVVAMDTPYSTP